MKIWRRKTCFSSKRWRRWRKPQIWWRWRDADHNNVNNMSSFGLLFGAFGFYHPVWGSLGSGGYVYRKKLRIWWSFTLYMWVRRWITDGTAKWRRKCLTFLVMARVYMRSPIYLTFDVSRRQNVIVFSVNWVRRRRLYGTLLTVCVIKTSAARS
jgi:hypothetical protein